MNKLEEEIEYYNSYKKKPYTVYNTLLLVCKTN